MRVAANAIVLNDSAGGIIPDTPLFAMVLGHDLGYSMSGIKWESREAVNHTYLGKKVLERWAKLFFPEALEYISRLPGSRYEVLEGMKESTDILPAVIKLADCLDYFHHDRVDGLPPPGDTGDYYYLAKQVVDYSLSYDPKTIRYEVKIEEGADDWHARVESAYPEVWELARTFTNQLGLVFEFIQM